MADRKVLTLPAVGAFGGFCQSGHEKSKGAKVPQATWRLEQAWRVKNALHGLALSALTAHLGAMMPMPL